MNSTKNMKIIKYTNYLDYLDCNLLEKILKLNMKSFKYDENQDLKSNIYKYYYFSSVVENFNLVHPIYRFINLFKEKKLKTFKHERVPWWRLEREIEDLEGDLGDLDQLNQEYIFGAGALHTQQLEGYLNAPRPGENIKGIYKQFKRFKKYLYYPRLEENEELNERDAQYVKNYNSGIKYSFDEFNNYDKFFYLSNFVLKDLDYTDKMIIETIQDKAIINETIREQQ